MSIVILVGGSCEQGNAEHRYLVTQFLEHFGDKVSQIITTRPTVRPSSHPYQAVGQTWKLH